MSAYRIDFSPGPVPGLYAALREPDKPSLDRSPKLGAVGVFCPASSASMSIMTQIKSLFAVPFGFAQLPRSEPLNARLRELFLAREAEGARYANPAPNTERNAPVFESRFDLFAWPQPDVVQLRDFCLSHLSRMIGQLSGFDERELGNLGVKTDAWFHITRRNGYFGVHNHPLASWSGVYCVAPGINDPDEPESGKLSFITPHHASGMYVDAGSERLKPPFGVQNFGICLEAGQLVLFPSFLLHHVLPFYGEGERITVAFNCSFQMRKG